MRYLARCVLAALPLAALGCSGSSGGLTPDPQSAAPPPSGPAPASYTGPVNATLGGFTNGNGITQSALAIYTVDVDVESLSATVHLKETRHATANDDLYLLSIDSFLRPDSFTVTAIGSDATTVTIDYVVKHPFPAPADLNAPPNGSTNRADLGITGMVLFLNDVASATGNTYFTDAIAETTLVENADAYYAPAGLLTVSGTANTFPYKELVDETADPRTSGATGSPISNSSDVTGNFGPDGWTRSEMGAGNENWTGFGALHQGQAAANQVVLDRAALATTSFSFDTAIVAKYNDPRGGANAAQKKANRLPPVTPDATKFAYRMPHGALDVSTIEFLGSTGQFLPNQTSGATLNFHVTDWDARATATTETDLAVDLDVTHVAIGEAGLPDFAVSIPGVLGDATVLDDWDPTADVDDDDTAFGGDAAADSGEPGDPLLYSKLVSKSVISGQTPGDYTGFARATDPEPTALIVPLGEDLLPLSANLPEAVTYQHFPIMMIVPNDPPTATVSGPGTPVASGNGVLTITVNPYNDPDSDPISIQFDWNNNGDFLDPGEALQVLDGTPPDTFNSPIFYNNATLAAENRNVPYSFTDGITPPVTGTVTFSLGPNQAPQLTGTITMNGCADAPATFSLNAAGFSAVDPEGETVTFTVTADAGNNGSVEQTGTSIATLAGYNAAPVMGPWNAIDSFLRFRAYANDSLRAGAAGVAITTVPVNLLGNVTVAPPAGWVQLAPTNPAGSDFSQCVAVDGSGNIFIAGNANTGVDFGGGPRTSTGTLDQYLVKLSSNGCYQWDKFFGAPGAFEQTWGLDTDAAGNVYMAGYFRGTMDMGGGGRTNNQAASTTNYDCYVVKYNSAGTYQWDFVTTGDGSGLIESGGRHGIDVFDATGEVALAGRFNRTETFGSFSLVNAAGALSTSFDPFVAKLNAAGVPVWATAYTMAVGSEIGTAETCAFDPSGDVYATGQFMTGANVGGGAMTTLLAGGTDAFITRRAGATGAYMWHRTIGSTVAGTENIPGISADANRLYVAGMYFNNTDFGGGLRTSPGGGDPFFAAYNRATGAYIWDRTFGGTSAALEDARSIVSDGTNLYGGGVYQGTVDFGLGARTTTGGVDAFAIKMNPATGATTYDCLWGSGAGTALEQVRAIGITSTGDPVMTGTYVNTVDFDPGAAVFNRTSAGGLADIFTLKLRGATGVF